MSDEETDLEEELETDDEQASTEISVGMRELRRDRDSKAKQLKSVESQLDELKRTNALLAAEVKLNETQQKALFATIEGEITPEIVREAAQKLGFVEAPTEEIPQGEKDSLQKLAAAPTQETPEPADPFLAGLEAASSSEKATMEYLKNSGFGEILSSHQKEIGLRPDKT